MKLNVSEKMKSVLCAVFLLGATACNGAAKATNEFPLITESSKVNIVVDSEDAQVVHIAAEMLAKDIYAVTDKKVSVNAKPSQLAVIAGTLGKSRMIKQLVDSDKIDISAIKGQWESYLLHVVDAPLAGVEKALVVVGSDRRATAYGLLEISRMIGVSPWEWWADVTPDKQNKLVLKLEDKVYGSPSVKYRGIFLNDEDWGLQRWAALTYEPETNDIGPKTYAKVFELLLRLRANSIWPAMHSSTKPFYFYPENKQVADDYAIVVGTSHCEPMLCNINMEWDSEKMGEWRYDNNSKVIKELFTNRVAEAAQFESIYTMGMRGEHDSPMIVGEDDTESQVKLLEKVVQDQRGILKTTTGKDASQLPQVFIPYKEVLTYYQNGMELPEDITLVWTDDNYGYIRQLSTPQEQLRKGGAGIYYHTSYWGRPHDYLWLNSTSPVLMWEEMSKAYEFQSRDLWVLNVGDIKPHEYNTELFLDMAWDMSKFENSDGVKAHMQAWAAREFGAQSAEAVTALMYENYRLAFQRRPEFMAWSQVEPVTKAGETELTQIHYGDEVGQRIREYQVLMEQAEKIGKSVPENRQDAYYQLVTYPVVGAASLNQKWLYAYKNQFTAQQGRASAAEFGQKSLAAFKRIDAETKYYNTQLKGGKWNHLMSMAPRYLPVFGKPTVAAPMIDGADSKLGVALESYEMELNHYLNNSHADVLPVFNAYTDNHYFVDLFLKGSGETQWKAQPRADWIKLTSTSGELNDQKKEQRVWVSIDWDKVPRGDNKKEPPLGHDYQLIPPSYKVNSVIDFTANGETISVGVSAFNPKLSELESYEGFIEDKGFISINAENYTKSQDGEQAKWTTFEGMGYSGKVMTALPRTAPSITLVEDLLKSSPVLEYDFYSFNFGDARVHVQAVPTHAFHEGAGVRIAVAIDDAEPVIVDFQTFGRSDEWKQNVLKNAARESVEQVVNQAGKHTLKVWMVDPGVLVDQILIDLGGWKDSYAFPPQAKH